MSNIPPDDRIRATNNYALASSEKSGTVRSKSEKNPSDKFRQVFNKEIEQLCRLMQADMNHRLLAVSTGDELGSVSLYRGLLIENLKQIINSPPSKNQQTGQSSGTSSGKQYGKSIDSIIEQASQIHMVDPQLIKAVIRAESGFRADATSPKGAMGLMQLMPKTAKELGVENSYDPYENIMAGTRYLRSLIDRYDGNIDKALGAYNWGMGNIERNPGKLPRETRDYIAKVYQYYNKEQT